MLGGLRVPASPFHLARVSPSLRLIQRTGKGDGGGYTGAGYANIRMYGVSWSFAVTS